MLELSCIVGARVVGKAVGQRFVHRHEKRRVDLVMRPERRRSLVVDQRESEHKRPVLRPLARMCGVKLLEPRQNHRREIVRREIPEELGEEVGITGQLQQKILVGTARHFVGLRRVIVRKKRLQNIRRNVGTFQTFGSGGKRASRAVGGKRHPGRNNQERAFLFRVLQNAPPEISIEHFGFGCAEQATPLREELPLAEDCGLRAAHLREIRRLPQRNQFRFYFIGRGRPTICANLIEIPRGRNPRNIKRPGNGSEEQEDDKGFGHHAKDSLLRRPAKGRSAQGNALSQLARGTVGPKKTI